MNRFLITLLSLLAFVVTDPAHAGTRQVGPTSFHKSFEIPNAMGTYNHNNEDSFFSPTKRQKRQNHRRDRQKEQNTQNEESRTQSDTVESHKRKGRRDNNETAQNRRLREQALQRYLNAEQSGSVNE